MVAGKASGREPPAAPGAIVAGAFGASTTTDSNPAAAPPALTRCRRFVGSVTETASLDSGASERINIGGAGEPGANAIVGDSTTETAPVDAAGD